MDITAHLDALAREGELLGQAAGSAGLDAPTPSCPEWMVRDLVRHIGQVHRWAAHHVRDALADQDPSLEDWPGDSALLAWYAEGHAALIKTLTAADPALDCWHFLPAPSGTRFWARRQAHETAIHRVDAQLATTDPPTPVDTEFAVDGIDEILHGFFGRRPTRLTSASPRSFGLVATDSPRTWRVVIDSSGPVTTPLDSPADAVVTAPANDLYLLLWNRRYLDGLDVTGSPDAFDLWRTAARIRWS
jgi:uncharacterized protein (TIGR03083 family)